MVKPFLLPGGIKSIMVFFLLVSVNAAVSAGEEAGVENTVELTVLMSKFSSGGAGSSFETTKLADKLLRLLEEKYGLHIKPEMVEMDAAYADRAVEKLAKEFKERGDIAFVWTQDYYYMKEAGIPVRPLIALEIDGSPLLRECFYARKDGAYKKLSDIRGAVISSGGMYSYLHIRRVLFESGIDEPLRSFFGRNVRIANAVSGIFALALGEVDAVFSHEFALGAARLADTSVSKKVKKLHCSTEGLLIEPFIVAKEGKKDRAIERFRNLILNSHKDKDFKKFFDMFRKITDFRFVVPDADAIEKQKRILDEWRKRGWNNEALEYDVDGRE
ncbi:MAG: PhnD/SsuA/transferrin family substrate-binding protein [bacterium]